LILGPRTFGAGLFCLYRPRFLAGRPFPQIDRTKKQVQCGFSALEGSARSRYRLLVMTGGFFMKKLALATAAVLALLSIAGCANVGKGKAPPPVVTKG
jgi:hypothetical protein